VPVSSLPATGFAPLRLNASSCTGWLCR
jgi:hypothetical protein